MSKNLKKTASEKAKAEVLAVPDIIKARAALNAARKAFDVIDRKRTKAMERLNKAQQTVDRAIAEIKADAPAGSAWGEGPHLVWGVDMASIDDRWNLTKAQLRTRK